LDSGPGSFYPSCELYLLICEQVGWGEDGVLAEYLPALFPLSTDTVMRRKSRENALQLLYGHDFKGGGWDEDTMDAAFATFSSNFDSGEKSVVYAKKIVEGVFRNRIEVDELLVKHAHNWRLERMTVVDRNILRIAAWEILYSDDVPVQVAINEALEIARRYSTEDAVAFINGILDSFEGKK
jgi:N utilization substance protein B